MARLALHSTAMALSAESRFSNHIEKFSSTGADLSVFATTGGNILGDIALAPNPRALKHRTGRLGIRRLGCLGPSTAEKGVSTRLRSRIGMEAKVRAASGVNSACQNDATQSG